MNVSHIAVSNKEESSTALPEKKGSGKKGKDGKDKPEEYKVAFSRIMELNKPDFGNVPHVFATHSVTNPPSTRTDAIFTAVINQ
mgnify:CR=1 FL=1